MTEPRTVIVTGASRGIGKASALAFAAEGCNVVLTSRKIETLDEVAAEITERFPAVGVLTHAAHAAEPDQAAAVVEAAMARFGAIDVLVNNAGTNPYFGPLMDIDPVRAEKTVRLNQFGPVLWSQLVWKASMSQRGAGTIVNVASVGGVLTEPGIGYYNATKAAVIHLTRQMAAELAPVRVNAVAPGIVRTHLARGLWESNEDFLNDKLPLGRIGEPDDIADVITFLAGPASRWMTGQALVVDGGAQIRSSLI
ncbi:SDR family oxidoreductase [Dactylosporangium sp. NPDC000244]|uniref:SDR family oxidoreductase n=1 Tax=Dactylosporangium sp. NPDC000244 TaxID=3154365 RepID=UPI003333CBF7